MLDIRIAVHWPIIPPNRLFGFNKIKYISSIAPIHIIESLKTFQYKVLQCSISQYDMLLTRDISRNRDLKQTNIETYNRNLQILPKSALRTGRRRGYEPDEIIFINFQIPCTLR
eukprot:Filipodium_phascolosomae@DN2207_c0_g1_i2.p1